MTPHDERNCWPTCYFDGKSCVILDRTPLPAGGSSHPHLTEELSRRIHALEVTSWLDKPIHHDGVSRGIALLVGEARTLIGRYRLDDLIAEGGFAQVWRGYDLELQRNVAVREIPQAEPPSFC